MAALAVIVAGCGGDEAAPSSSGQTGFGPAPAAPGGELSTETEAAVDSLVDSALEGTLDEEALGSVASSKDPRLGWLLSDLLRFSQGGSDAEALVDAFGGLTGADVRDDPDFEVSPWQSVTDHLIAWDLPAPPGYRERKARIFLAVEPRWEPFFADADSAIDWPACVLRTRRGSRPRGVLVRMEPVSSGDRSLGSAVSGRRERALEAL